MSEHFDVLIIGAGLSGLGAAVHLQRDCPRKTFALLEAREGLGGTWDLFRYPGIRSDSDMFTLGYSFKPWKERKAIADGPAILEYLRETAREHRLEEKIRYRHKVVGASWSSDTTRWTVTVERGPERERVTFTCGFLHVCSGYYDYDAGYTPELPGRALYQGTLVHPQHWPEGLDYKGKRVVVLGSGATAMTLVPAMARDAGHVTMLQRSPTYVLSRPAEDKLALALRRWLPEMAAYDLARWKNVALGMVFFELAQRRPAEAKKHLLKLVRRELGPDYDVATHFTPRYGVWDQRVCLVPDGDLFVALREGRASVVTDELETFTPTGLKLRSGRELEADIVVTATGLQLKFLGGLALEIDGHRVEQSKLVNYKGSMFSDVPNLACTFGYTNASWTLKADLTAQYIARLLSHMDKIGATQCTPRQNDPTLREVPFLNLTSGYIQRAKELFPKQGDKRPWRLFQNYLLDILLLRGAPIEDEALEFAGPGLTRTRAPRVAPRGAAPVNTVPSASNGAPPLPHA